MTAKFMNCTYIQCIENLGQLDLVSQNMTGRGPIDYSINLSYYKHHVVNIK